jgi:xanthine/CO dehydrogenase XdhC/CoxF family maturation factor
LSIGSKTPAEIAVSILAQLTQVRSQQDIAAGVPASFAVQC